MAQRQLIPMATVNSFIELLRLIFFGVTRRELETARGEPQIAQTPQIVKPPESPPESRLPISRTHGSGELEQGSATGQETRALHTEKDAIAMEKTKIILDRYLSDSDATLSRLYVKKPGGKLEHVSYCVEDEHRAVKVYGETRIPAGTYDITIRDFGEFHKRHLESRVLSVGHIGMLWLRNVPGFENILIHTGNDDDDTAGCLVVGAYQDEKQMKVYLSRDNYRKLYDMVKDDARKGNLIIEIQDNDGVTS